jgi:large subunit ribosomal protein L18
MLKPDRIKRKRRIRSKIVGTKSRPRVNVYKSNLHIYAQAIDDSKGVTIAACDDSKVKGKSTKVERATVVGGELAKKLVAAKITEVVFDRGGYRYHGRIKAVAEGLRQGGIKV